MRGSKESRIADRVRSGAGLGHVLVLGHPYVDIWQAVKPARLGLAGWPEVPRTLEWKHGICTALGLPHRHQADLAAAWRMTLDQVRSWDDLERPLLTVVEQLIDFVTEDHPRCRRGPIGGAEAMQPSPIAETSRGTCPELPSSCLSFPAAEGVRWLVSLPEDETVLTVVRGVVVLVELIRPGRRRFLAIPRVHPPRSLVVVSFRG